MVVGCIVRMTRYTRLLARIAWLLRSIVLVFLMAFCFFAGSFCIALLLAAFLAILVDSVVTRLERWRVPRPACEANCF